MGNYKIIKVFDCMTEEMVNKISNLLIVEDGFSVSDANARAKEILFVALDENDNVIGTCSGYPKYIDQVRGWFLYYRSFTSRHWRDFGMSYTLIAECRKYFNENRMFMGKELVGIYATFDSAILNRIKLYVAKSGLTIIGFTESGVQMRVLYFDGASLQE